MHPAKATPPTTGGGIIVVEAVPPWKAEVPTLQESLKQTAKVDGRQSRSVGPLSLDLYSLPDLALFRSLPHSTHSSWVIFPCVMSSSSLLWSWGFSHSSTPLDGILSSYSLCWYISKHISALDFLTSGLVVSVCLSGKWTGTLTFKLYDWVFPACPHFVALNTSRQTMSDTSVVTTEKPQYISTFTFSSGCITPYLVLLLGLFTWFRLTGFVYLV